MLHANGSLGNGSNPLKTIRDMASSDATILTTGCNVCWVAGDAGMDLATFFINGTDRKYLGNQASTQSRDAYNEFKSDDWSAAEPNKETHVFRFSKPLVKVDNYAGFVLYSKDSNGKIAFVKNYYSVQTDVEGRLKLTVMKTPFQINRDDPNNIEIKKEKIGTVKKL